MLSLRERWSSPCKTTSSSMAAMEVDDQEDEDSHAAAAAAAAADDADIEQLAGMGFTRSQARDALEEAGGNVEVAIEWLCANCI